MVQLRRALAVDPIALLELLGLLGILIAELIELAPQMRNRIILQTDVLLLVSQIATNLSELSREPISASRLLLSASCPLPRPVRQVVHELHLLLLSDSTLHEPLARSLGPLDVAERVLGRTGRLRDSLLVAWPWWQ